jgi:hypothetical protein
VVVALVAAVLGTASTKAGTVVSVRPAVGSPDTAFRVSVPATFSIAQPAYDRYWFIVHGPGGRKCESSVTDRVGITPPKRAKRVAVDLPGVRVVSKTEIVPGPWCVGTFKGHVEFRDWRPRSHRYVIHRIGTFSWQVEDAG